MIKYLDMSVEEIEAEFQHMLLPERVKQKRLEKALKFKERRQELHDARKAAKAAKAAEKSAERQARQAERESHRAELPVEVDNQGTICTETET